MCLFSLPPRPPLAFLKTIWNPIFGVMFFTYLGLTEGKSFGDIQKKIKNDLATAVMGSWTVWIPAHTINFKFVPTSQRLLYINTIQVRTREGLLICYLFCGLWCLLLCFAVFFLLLVGGGRGGGSRGAGDFVVGGGGRGGARLLVLPFCAAVSVLLCFCSCFGPC